jgi:hypothetical protein
MIVSKIAGSDKAKDFKLSGLKINALVSKVATV